MRFADGSVEPIDRIVYCTGYKISFPFFDHDLLDPSEDNRIELYRRVVHPDLHGPVLHRPRSAAVRDHADRRAPVGVDRRRARGQGRAARACDDGQGDREGPKAMDKRYVASKRHTIQVDGPPYMRQLARERRRHRVGQGERGPVQRCESCFRYEASNERERPWLRRPSQPDGRSGQRRRAGADRGREPRHRRDRGTVPRMTPEDVGTMVARARAAQPGWEAMGFEGRARVLRRAQKWVLDNSDRVIRTIVSETGKTWDDAQTAEIGYAAAAFGFWAKNAEKYLADEKRPRRLAVPARQEVRGALPPAGRGGRHRPLELPAHQLVRRLHPGAGRRQRRDPQAVRGHSADVAADGRDAGGVRAARGRVPGGSPDWATSAPS